MTRRILLPSLILLLALLPACGGEEDLVHDAAPADPTGDDAGVRPEPAEGPAEEPAGEPSGAPMVSSAGAPVGEEGAAAAQGRLGVAVPDHWIPEPPSNSMRLTQATIPGEAGEGQFALFHFGPGGGGGTEANLQRWIDQMGGGEGEVQRESFELDGLKVTWIDVRGTLQPSTMGMGPETPQPDHRLLGAVVEGPGGPWFFKLTGPEATLEGERPNFLEMLGSLEIG